LKAKELRWRSSLKDAAAQLRDFCVGETRTESGLRWKFEVLTTAASRRIPEGPWLTRESSQTTKHNTEQLDLVMPLDADGRWNNAV